MLFSAIVLDFHPYVADEVFAKEEGMFGQRLVAGSMVFSLGLGLMAHNNIHTFSYGYDKLRFIKAGFNRRYHLHDSYAPGEMAQVPETWHGSSLL